MAKKSKYLKVSFPDSTTFCYRSPKHTVLAALAKIGSDRFHEIKLEIRKHPLVSQEIYPELKNYTDEICPNWYYISQTDTDEKFAQLLQINKQLNLNLTIECNEDLKPSPNPKKQEQRSKRPKHRLVVTMPDGELVDYDSYRDVFMTVIDKLGPRTVSSKANFDLNSNQPLLTVTNPDGTRRKVAESLYLALPQTAKQAAKILYHIAIRLGIVQSMKIDVTPQKI